MREGRGREREGGEGGRHTEREDGESQRIYGGIKGMYKLL